MPCSSRGDVVTGRNIGPAVVLVHGVGVGPESFAETAGALTAGGRRVHRVVRRGYGAGRLTLNPDMKVLSLDAQVELIIEDVMQREEQPTVWVGVSGGATLGMIAACRRPAVIHGAVLHEPLIGTRAAALHDGVQAAAARLAAGQLDPATVGSSAAEFVAGLVGPASWEALGVVGRALVVERAHLVGAEVPIFATFEAPSVDDLDIPVVITVGERSPAPRHEAAEGAAELLGGRVEVIAGIGHLPQIEAPAAFAELIAKCRVTGTEIIAGTNLVADTTPYPWPYDAALSMDRVGLIVLGWSDGWWEQCHEPERAAGSIVRLADAVGLVVVVDQPPPGVHGPVEAIPASGRRPTLEGARPVGAAGVDGFFGGPLDAVLRAARCDLLLLAGLGLEAAVHSTMRSANDRGYECLLVVDACAPLNPDLVRPAISMVEMSGGIFGAVGTTAPVLAALAAASTPDPVPDFSERTR